MRKMLRNASVCLLSSLAVAIAGSQATAQVIFHDDYTTQPVTEPTSIYEIPVTPNIVTTGATYYGQFGPDQHHAQIKQDPFGVPVGRVLEWKTGPGYDSIFLPHQMVLTGSTDILRISATFAKPTGGPEASPLNFNNMFFGFRGTGANAPITDFILFKNGGIVQNFVPRADWSFDDANATLSTMFNTTVIAQDFNSIAIEYNPSKLSTQPWSLTWNGVKMDMPKHPNSQYVALQQIEGVGFGSLFSDGGDRSVWMREFKFEVIPQSLEGDLDGDGFVGQSDLNLILGNWGQSVPPADPLADPDGSGSVGQGDLNKVLIRIPV
ncbi:MAG: hypothetical protein SGJ20_02070 [Planctomycetota bacterium]|nr:hypothetical protein [Planctomycetota bacterium]